MKIYKYEGSGIWLGSVVIVVAGSVRIAKLLIRRELDKIGLRSETIDENNITEKQIKKGVLYSDNGDY